MLVSSDGVLEGKIAQAKRMYRLGTDGMKSKTHWTRDKGPQ